MKSRIILILLLFLIAIPAIAEPPALPFTEIVSVDSQNDGLDINVSNSYPEVTFDFNRLEKKIIIELQNSIYGSDFKFDIPTKKNILDGLPFVLDVSIGEAKYGEKSKVGIQLFLKEESKDLIPQVIAKSNNSIRIVFSKKIPDIVIEPKEQKKEKQKEPEEEKPVIEEVKKEKFVPKSVIDIYNAATDAYSSGELNKAESLYKEVLEKDPNFFLAKFNLSNIFLEREEFEKAVSLLSELDDKFSYFFNADKKNLLIVKNTLGIVYYSNGEYEKGLQQFNEIIEVDPNVHEPYYNLGLIYEKMDDLEKAKANFDKAISLKPDFADAYYHLGILNKLTKKKKQAIYSFEKALQISPESKVGVLSLKELKKLDKKYKEFK